MDIVELRKTLADTIEKVSNGDISTKTLSLMVKTRREISKLRFDGLKADYQPQLEEILVSFIAEGVEDLPNCIEVVRDGLGIKIWSTSKS